MATNRNRFSRTNQVTTCTVCDKRTTDHAGEGTSLCGRCYYLAGLENEHADGYHDDQPNAECPTCKDAAKV